MSLLRSSDSERNRDSIRGFSLGEQLDFEILEEQKTLICNRVDTLVRKAQCRLASPTSVLQLISKIQAVEMQLSVQALKRSLGKKLAAHLHSAVTHGAKRDSFAQVPCPPECTDPRQWQEITRAVEDFFCAVHRHRAVVELKLAAYARKIRKRAIAKLDPFDKKIGPLVRNYTAVHGRKRLNRSGQEWLKLQHALSPYHIPAKRFGPDLNRRLEAWNRSHRPEDEIRTLGDLLDRGRNTQIKELERHFWLRILYPAYRRCLRAGFIK